MTKNKNYKCLMIETVDHRKFLTHKKNYPQLIEFANTFNAEISSVLAEDAEILELAPLAKAFSNPSYVLKGTFKKLDNIRANSKAVENDKHNMRNVAAEIKQYIHDKFTNGESVSLKHIAEHFNKLQLTKACFCNHIAQVKKDLEKEGFEIKKVSSGTYSIK